MILLLCTIYNISKVVNQLELSVAQSSNTVEKPMNEVNSKFVSKARFKPTLLRDFP